MRDPHEPPIVARGLTKRFGRFTAVDGIDFEVYRGEAFGFLGPNGAGKTSTMRMIACTSPVTGGELRVMGMDPRRQATGIKSRLGVVPQLDNLELELTSRENLLMYARYFSVPEAVAGSRAEELLRFVQLEERADQLVEPLSGGMKRRLTIARALINDPELILLDEPTTGLDPQARQLVWERLYQLKKSGRTLVLTTHYMEEAERLCDRLVVMDKARIVAEGAPLELIRRYTSREVVEVRLGAEERTRLDGIVKQLAERTEDLSDRLLLYTSDGEAAMGKLRAEGIPEESLYLRRASLEDVFLRLTGRSLIE